MSFDPLSASWLHTLQMRLSSCWLHLIALRSRLFAALQLEAFTVHFTTECQVLLRMQAGTWRAAA